MKSKLKSIEECTTLFEIEVPAKDIATAFEEVYNEITKVANIPGFRVGKAPKELVKKHYSKNAKDEVLQRLIPEAYRMALTEHKVNPVGLPEISDVKFEEEKLLSFKAKVDTRPKFKLKDYKGIKVSRKKVNISAEDVDKTLQNLRELNATYVTAEDRPVQMGDYAVSDMECFVDGKPLHQKRENLWLFVDKDSTVPGLSEQMVGIKKGELKDIELNLPKNYPDKFAAGKSAKYHILVKDIKVRKLPEINDDLAKGLGKDSIEDVKKEISKELEYRGKINAEVECENELLGKLMDDNVFEVPSNFVNRQIEYMVEDAKRHLMEKGFKKEDLDKKNDELKDKFKSDAVRRVRLLFILDDIARNEKIEVSDSDVQDAYKSIATQTGKAEDAVKNYYEKEELVDGLKDKIKETKAIQFLLKAAEITEK
ncbi:MAG: trigger factor [Candidatus Omnitrophota bacterium]|jgi:trigger factor